MKKRILSLILTVLMMLSLFSAFSIDAFAAGGAIEFTYKPTVYFGGGGEYNIVWKTNTRSVGYVTYRYGGKSYTVYDEEGGVVRSDDSIHSVRVPQEHLDAAGSYEVTSVSVGSRKDYSFDVGMSVTASSSFTGYHDQKEIKFAFFSDTHLMTNNKKTLDASKMHLDSFMGGADVIVLNGDISNNMPTEADFDLILEIANTLSGGSIPVLFAKGNHECRGYFAQKLYKYLVFNTNEFYAQWDYGPVSGITIDIGEDKEDDHPEYYGVDDMDHYFDEQEVWLQNMGGYSEDSQYHISIGHSPTFIDRYKTLEYANYMKNYETDVLVCGHSHNQKFVPATDSGNKIGIPTVHDGGHTNNDTMRTTLLTMSNGTYHFKAFTETGGVAWEQTLETNRKAKSPSPSVSEPANTPAEDNDKTAETDTDNEQPETVENDTTPVDIPTAAGISTMSLKGAGDTTSITVKPVVFDCGYYYCVVWQTTAGNECAGYVEVTNGSDNYSYMDSFAGKLRTETTHSVKIPKTVFNGATYYVRNRVVTCYGMYGIVGNPKTSYGPYVNGGAIKFLGDSENKAKKYNIAVFANTPVESNDANAVKNSFTGNPNLIVSLGDMVNSINTEEDFGNYLRFMNIVSNGGAIPVLYLRGEGESKGEFAANIGRYIRNTTDTAVIGKFYLNTSIGEIAIVGLDTATSANDKAAQYNGYAAFDSIRAEQNAWMDDYIYNSFVNKYNIVFANGDGLDNYLGVNFAKSFTRLETNLVVTAGTGKSSFTDRGNLNAIATCGSPAGDNTMGLMITCQNDEISVRTLGEGAKDLGTVDITVSSAKNDTSTPTDPDDPDDPGNNNSGNGNGDNGNSDNNGGNNSGNNNGNGNNSGNNNGGSDYDDDYNKGDGDSNGGETIYEPGEFDGIDGDMYVRTIPDGWYRDYKDIGFKYAVVTSITANGTTTESVFIEIVSNLVGIDHSLYDASTKADKAAAWAEEYGIYSGYLGGENILTDGVINTVVTGLFPTESAE